MSDIQKHYLHMEETGVPKRFTHVLYPNEVLHLFSYGSDLIFLTTHHWMKPFLFWWRKSNWVLHPISNICSSLYNLYGDKALDFICLHYHVNDPLLLDGLMSDWVQELATCSGGNAAIEGVERNDVQGVRQVCYSQYWWVQGSMGWWLLGCSHRITGRFQTPKNLIFHPRC